MKKSIKLIFTPAFSAIDTPTILAGAPTNVILPPRQAPKDNAHHSTSVCPVKFGAMFAMIFEKDRVYGTDPSIGDNSDEINTTTVPVFSRFPSVNLTIASPSCAITPSLSTPSTKTNNPPKKNRVSHSTFLYISSGLFLLIVRRITDPVIEITASPMLVTIFVRNPIRIIPNKAHDCIRSFLFFYTSVRLQIHYTGS